MIALVPATAVTPDADATLRIDADGIRARSLRGETKLEGERSWLCLAGRGPGP